MMTKFADAIAFASQRLPSVAAALLDYQRTGEINGDFAELLAILNEEPNPYELASTAIQQAALQAVAAKKASLGWVQDDRDIEARVKLGG